MSTIDHPTTHKSTAAWYLGIVAGLAVALGLALAVANAGHADTAAGIVTGGMLVVVLAATGRLRSSRAADRAGTATRLAAGRPDERDVRVHQGSLAILGIVSVILSGLASAATFLGLDATTIVRSMPFALLLTAVVAFAVVNRRT